MDSSSLLHLLIHPSLCHVNECPPKALLSWGFRVRLLLKGSQSPQGGPNSASGDLNGPWGSACGASLLNFFFQRPEQSVKKSLAPPKAVHYRPFWVFVLEQNQPKNNNKLKPHFHPGASASFQSGRSTPGGSSYGCFPESSKMASQWTGGGGSSCGFFPESSNMASEWNPRTQGL